MRRKHLKIGIALLVVTAAVALSGQEKPLLNLGTAVRSAVFGNFVGAATPFLNGFRPEWEYKQTWVRLYDSKGTMIRKNEVSLPGAELVSIINVSVSRSGMEAVAASALNSDGAEAGIIVLFDQPGPPRLVIRTNPFIAALVAIDPEGFIWIAGTDPGVEFGRPLSGPTRPHVPLEEKQGLCVLQKYTASGVLVGNFLKRSTFDSNVYPWNSTNRGGAALRASTSGVGLFVPHAYGSGEWVELSLTGDVTGRWTVA